jgi:hypothetical protein
MLSQYLPGETELKRNIRLEIRTRATLKLRTRCPVHSVVTHRLTTIHRSVMQCILRGIQRLLLAKIHCSPWKCHHLVSLNPDTTLLLTQFHSSTDTRYHVAGGGWSNDVVTRFPPSTAPEAI